MNSLEGIKSELVIDPRQADLYREPLYAIRKSLSQITANQYAPNTLGIAAASWNTITPPSLSTIIDRRFYLYCEVQLDFTGDSGGGNNPYLLPVSKRYPSSGGIGVLDTQFISLRALPLNSVISSANISINSAGMATNTNTYSTVLPFTLTDHAKEIYNMVSQPDHYQQYAEAIGQNNNPMASYGLSMFEQSRGDAEYVIVSNSQTAARLIIRWYEPLIYPGLLSYVGEAFKGGFVNVQNININLTFQNFQNIMSIANFALPTGWASANAPQVNLSTMQFLTCNLQLLYLTPTLALPSVPITNKYSYYNYYNNVVNTTAVVGPAGPDNPNAQKYNLSSGNIQLQTIPHSILIFVNKSKNVPNGGNLYNQTDCLASISNLNINFSNFSSLFGSYTPYQLWQMSATNGVNMSFFQWSKRMGSLIIINPALDLPSSPLAAVGSLENNNIVINVTYTDINPVACANENSPAVTDANCQNPNSSNYQLTVVFVYENVLTITDGVSTVTETFDKSYILKDLMSGLVDQDLVSLDSSTVPHHGSDAVGSGSFWSSARSLFSKGATSLARLLQQNPQYLDVAAQYAQNAISSALPGYASPFVQKGVEYGKSALQNLISKYAGQGYSNYDIYKMLAPHYPRHVLEDALISATGQGIMGGELIGGELIGGELIGGDISGGRRISHRRLKARRY